jgi:hypothetical protein
MAVAGEPSLGTPHPHYAVLVSNADPSGTGYTSVDCSAQVPVGATMIYVVIQCQSTAVEDTLALYTDSTPTPAQPPVIAITQVANKFVFASGMVRLSSTRTFVYKGTAAMSQVYIYMYLCWS